MSDLSIKTLIKFNFKEAESELKKWTKDMSNKYTINFNMQNIEKEVEKINKTTDNFARKQYNLLKKYNELLQLGNVSGKDLTLLGNRIVNAKSIETLKLAEEQYRKLYNITKENLKVQNAEYKAKQKQIISDQKRVSSLGELVGSYEQLKGARVTEKELADVISKKYKEQEIREISLDRVTGKWSATIKESAKSNRILKGTLDKTTGSLYKQSEAVRRASASQLGLLEQFKIALVRVPIWMAAMTAFWGSLRSAQSGVGYIAEIDKAFTDLKKVTEENIEILKEFRLEANQIGKVLGKTTTEVIQATTEFSRLGYSLQEAQKLAQEALLYSSVGDIDIQTASRDLISTIKGFGIAVDQEGKKIRKIVDLYNEIGNNFAITSAGIGEALRRSSASLYEAGNTIEESIALITAANASIQDTKRVGTAMKTISMRIRGLSDEGKKIPQLVPQMEQAFNSIGLTLKKNDNTFKSTYEIFKDLSEVWDKLSDFQRANLLEMIGGKRQGVVVSSIINNWDDATKALEIGLKSSGSAMKEFEKYMDSLEYKVNRFKNTLVGFWQENLDTEGIKNIIDSGTILLQILTKLTKATGLLPPVVAGVTTALFALNNTIRSLIMESKSLELSLLGLRISFVSLGTAVKGVMTFISRAFLPITIITAASYAIQKLIGHFMKLKQETEKIKRRNDELVDSWIKNRDEIEKNIKRYKELKQMKELSSEQEQELIDVQNKLNQLMPTLTKEIDKQGNAHLKNIDLIKKEIDYVKKLTENYNKIKLNNFNKEIEETFNKIKKIEIRIDNLRNRLRLPIRNNFYIPITKDEQLNIEQKIIANQYEMARLQQKLVEIVKDRTRAYLDIEGVLDKVNDATWKYINTLIEENKVLLKDKKSVQNLAAKVVDYSIAIIEAQNNLKGLSETSRSYQHVVEKLRQQWQEAGYDLDVLNKIIEENRNKLKNNNKEIQEQLLTLSQLQEKYKSTSNDLELLSQAEQELNEEGVLSQETLDKLIEKYHDFISVTGLSTKEMLKFINMKKEERINWIRDEKIKTDKTIEEVKKRIQALREERNEILKTYKQQLDRYVASGTMSRIEAMRRYEISKKYYLGIEEDRLEKLKNKSEYLDYLNKISNLSKDQDGKSKIKSPEMYKIDKIAQQIDEINLKIVQSEGRMSKYNETSSEYRAELEKQIELQRQLQKIYSEEADKLRERNKVIRSDYVFQLDYNKMTDEQKERFNRLSKELEENIKTINNYSSAWWDAENKIDSASEEIKQSFEKIKEAYKEWEDSVNDIADEVIDIYKEIYQKQKEVAINAIEDELESLEKSHQEKMDYLDEELSKYEEIINAKLKLLDQQEDEEDYQKRLAKLQEEQQEIQNKINVLSLDDSVEAKAEREKLAEELAQKKEEIEELQLKHSRDLQRKNLQNQLENYKKDIEKKKESEKNKFEATKQELEKEREEIERHYDNLINDERRFARIREEILDGHLDNIKDDFDDFEDFISANMENIGESISLNMIDKIKEAMEELENLQNIEIELPSSSSGYNSRTGFPGDQDDNDAVPHGDGSYDIPYHDRDNDDDFTPTDDQLRNVGIDPDDYNNLNERNREAIDDYIRQMEGFHTGGIVGGKGNKLTEFANKLFNIKPGEQIVKALKGELFIPPQNIPNIFSNMSKLATATAGGNTYNLTFNIDKVTGDQKGANLLTSKVVNGIKKLGGDI